VAHPVQPAGQGQRAARQGREDIFIGGEYDASAGKNKLPDYAVRHYIETLASDPVALHGSFQLYRAFPATTVQNQQRNAEQVLARAKLGPYVDEHIATMARLHRENRYDRRTATVEEITGRPAESVEEFIAQRTDLFAG
jgi:hypothetical protein